MPQLKLSADSIPELNGGVARKIIDHEIDLAVHDLDDRAEEDGKPRKVTIELTLDLVEGMVVAKVAAQAKLPPRLSGGTQARKRGRTGDKVDLLFQTESPHNADQPGLADHLPPDFTNPA